MDQQLQSAIFSRLPTEIRHRIYDYSLFDYDVDYFSFLFPSRELRLRGTLPALASTCKLAFHEMLPKLKSQADIFLNDKRVWDNFDVLAWTLSGQAVEIGCLCYLPSVSLRDLQTVHIFLNSQTDSAWCGLIFLGFTLSSAINVRELGIEWKLDIDFDKNWRAATGRPIEDVAEQLDLSGLKKLRTVHFFGYLPLDWQRAIQASTTAKLFLYDMKMNGEPFDEGGAHEV